MKRRPEGLPYSGRDGNLSRHYVAPPPSTIAIDSRSAAKNRQCNRTICTSRAKHICVGGTRDKILDDRSLMSTSWQN